MRKRLAVVLVVAALAVVALAGCAAMAARRAAREARLNAAREAWYAAPRDDVMKAALNVLLGRYEIERNLVERGVIETKLAIEERGTRQHRIRITATLEGDDPYRVVFSADTYRREVDSARTTPWARVEGTDFENDLYLEFFGMLEQSAVPRAESD